MPQQSTNIDKLYDQYDKGTVKIEYENTSLELAPADGSCNVEANWQLRKNYKISEVPLNGLVLAALVPIKNRFQAVGGGTKHTINYPCSACVLGTRYDDLVISRWQRGQTTEAYRDCYQGAQNGRAEYWDICCIINQILFRDMRGIGICGQQAQNYSEFKYFADRLYGIKLSDNPCNNGGIQFIATIRPVLQVIAEAEASVATPNGIVTRKGKRAVVVKKYGRQVNVTGKLKPVLDVKKNAATGNQWPNKLKNYNGYPKSCTPELLEQTRTSDRPCGFGCEQCPTYKATLSCGYSWFECRDYRYGFAGPRDIRCTQAGLSTNPNTNTPLNNLGDIISHSVNGDDVSYCDNSIDRQGSLPCSPPSGAMASMFSYAKELAVEINNTNLDGMFQDALNQAAENAKKLLDSVPDKCSPIAIEFLQVKFNWLYQ